MVLATIAASGLCTIATLRAAEESTMGSNGKSNLSQNDKRFLRKAYKGGLEEVENAKVAKEKAQNDATKDVADHMITDHTKANQQLESIAKEENFDLTRIKAKSMTVASEDFDKKYLTALKDGHETTIAMFEKEANDPGTKEDSDVKKFAQDTLPTLKEHLKMVEDALAKVEKK